MITLYTVNITVLAHIAQRATAVYQSVLYDVKLWEWFEKMSLVIVDILSSVLFMLK
jgi:hypothetical protein